MLLESLVKDTVNIQWSLLELPQAHTSLALLAYQNLKATPLYDPIREQWNLSISEQQLLAKPDRLSTAQLVGVLIEASFDRIIGENLYNKLKASALYDTQTKEWHYSMAATQVVLDFKRYTENQLLGVLAEFQFNPSRAKELYEELKASRLYDQREGIWYGCLLSIVDQHPPPSLIFTEDQILAVLVEAQFNKVSAMNLIKS